jgi:threonine 3-dehydrogenase
MKAIVKQEPKEGLAWLDVPVPKVGPHDVLVKTIRTSICGTDIHLYKWDDWAQKTLPVPCIIGHEFVGQIVEIGSSVTKFKVGDRVSAEGHITCGKCLQCLTGNRVLCPNTVGIGVNRDGCFAEHVAFPEENGFLMPPEIPDDVASIFDPLGNGVHTALMYELAAKDVLITGAGPIGLMSIAIAKKAGARHVVITDLNDYRLAIAEKMGAIAVNITQETVEDVLSELKIEGFDVCLEMSGSAAAFKSIPYYLKHGGHLVILGILPTTAEINWHQVIFKMLTIKGIYGREIFRTWYQTLHLLQSGLDISPVITHRFPAREFQKGFDAMLSGQSGKVILDWTSL